MLLQHKRHAIRKDYIDQSLSGEGEELRHWHTRSITPIGVRVELLSQCQGIEMPDPFLLSARKEGLLPTFCGCVARPFRIKRFPKL